MVPSALLLPVDNPTVGRNISAKPKVQPEPAESQNSESFARHLEKSRERQSETTAEKPLGKLTKRHKPDQQSTSTNQPTKPDSRVLEEKPQSSELTTTNLEGEENDQGEQPNLSPEIDSSPKDSGPDIVLNLDIKPVQPSEEVISIPAEGVVIESADDEVDAALVIDASVNNLIDDKETNNKPLELAGDNDQSLDLMDEIESDSIAIKVTTDAIAEEPQTAVVVTEANSPAVKTTTKDGSVDSTLEAYGKISLVAKNGTDLPPDATAGQSDSGESELTQNLDMNNDLLIKGDDKPGKTEQFKLMMSQLNPADSKPQDKPVSPLINPVSTTNLQQVANELAPANRLFVPQTQLGMNVAHPNWGKAMGDKIMWMANQQLSSADIRLDPPELGSLQVKIHMQQDQATVTFVSPHPQVRELLDQQVTRLREMFADQGLQLGQVNVADKQEQHSRQFDDQPKSRGGFADDELEDVQIATVSSLYLVDQFV